MMRSSRNDPFGLLDFVDFLNLMGDQIKAVGSLLCCAGHPMTENECHQLSVLIEHLAGDMKAETDKVYTRWKETR